MKKLLIMAIAAVSAVALHAATVSWTITNVKYGNTASAGTAYVFFVAAASADTSWVSALDGKSASDITSAVASHGAAISYTPGTAGTYSYTTAQGFTLKTNSQLGLTGNTQYTAYAVIFDTEEIAAGSHFMVTGTRTSTTYDDTSSANRSFQIGSQASATWYTAVPEPTSGLLMLLGMAGLALRRKQK